MTQSPLIIRELDRIARERRWTGARLAAFVGVDETLLAHIRAGRKRITSETLSKIALRFTDSSVMRDLVWHYLAVEHPEKNAADPRGDRKPVEDVPPELPSEVRKTIRAYVISFLRAYFEGRGLLLVGSNPAALRAAASYLAAECRARNIGTIHLNASTRVTSTEGRAATAAHLVMFDRLDSASASALEVVRARLSAVRPFVATSVSSTPIADAAVARALKSRLQEVHVGVCPAPPAAMTHAVHV